MNQWVLRIITYIWDSSYFWVQKSHYDDNETILKDRIVLSLI